MQTKLTLRVDSDVVARSKKVARQRGQSISKIVEDHLNKLAPIDNKKVTKQPIAEWILELWKINDEWRKRHRGRKRKSTKSDADARYEYYKKKYA
jgi:predicted transcriptional regulator